MRVVHELDEVPWQAFVANNPQANIFHTPEMFQVFARTCGYRPSLLAVQADDGRVLALLPTVQITILGGLLRPLTTRTVAYGSVLCEPTPEGQAALGALLRGYNRAVPGGALLTELRNLSDMSEAQPVLEKRVRDSVLGKMSRLIGHDMRQPVQGLRNSLDTILNHISDADDTAKKHFRLCYDSLDWINDFIEDILTVGREKPLVRKPLSANDLVRTTKASVKVPERVALTTALEANLPLCPIDEKEAKKALMNILKNALEAVGPGGKVEISTAPAGEHVRVLVSDNGPGFPPEKKARLFQEFTTKESGTGLGLLVVKKVMDQHGGKVELESEEGKGTRISLLFPVRPD